MTITSVSGSLMEQKFVDSHKKWKLKDPREFFTDKISQKLIPDMKKVKENLQAEAKTSNELIIWTDYDREGEAIGKQIAKICTRVNKNLTIKRAKFSAVTENEALTALSNLGDIRDDFVEASLAREEIDLRIGFAFTNHQMKQLKQISRSEGVLSFGPCQIPTLGFVVRRADEVNSFKQTPYWKLKLEVIKSPFLWNHQKVNSRKEAEVVFKNVTKAIESKEFFVTEVVRNKVELKKPPNPLNTIDLQIAASSHLKIDSTSTMKSAEKLYQRGFISYPRTDTTDFGSLDPLPLLHQLGKTLTRNDVEEYGWLKFLKTSLSEKTLSQPNKTGRTDEAHPPLYPTKLLRAPDRNNFTETDLLIYELIFRTHLASLSPKAKFAKSSITLSTKNKGSTEANKYLFTAKGKELVESNYLDIYKYQTQQLSTLPKLKENDIINKKNISLFEIKKETTKPPEYLSEVELIKLMEKHQIGTDATLQKHIAKILERKYISKFQKVKNEYLQPTDLGTGLIQTYINLGYQEAVTSPELRSEMERDLKAISEGKMKRNKYVKKYIAKYSTILDDIYKNKAKFREVFKQMNI